MFSSRVLLLACWVAAAWGVRPPRLDVGAEVVAITSDQRHFQMRCEGSQKLSWKWDTSLPKDEATIDDETQDDSEYPFVSNFKVYDPLPGDTGFYYCHYANDTDKDMMASTYVYVYDGEDILVNHGHSSVVVFTNEKLVLDCRTTLPNATLTLKKGDEEVTSQFLWDPKIGFVRRNLVVHDSGFYVCLSDSTDESQTIHVIVHAASGQLRDPSIDEGPNPHFVVGHPFSLNCTLIKENIEAALHWSYPNNGAMYPVSTSKSDEGDKKYIVSTLLVPKASTKDSGEYTCTATASQSKPTSDSISITVKEDMGSFVKISSTDKIIVNQSNELMWKAEVHSFPHNPHIVYTNWKGEKLTQNGRIAIEFQPATASSWLTIHNVTSDDFGEYTLTATTNDGHATDSVTVRIEIKSAPLVNVTGVPAYLLPGARLNISCVAQGFPVPSIAWDFQSCPNGRTSCSPSEDAEAGEASVHYPSPGNLVTSNIFLRPSSSGYLKCLANNSLHTADHTVPVSLSDIDGLHVLRHTGLNTTTEIESAATITVITNDNFFLLCGGNKLHYKAVNLHTPLHSGLAVQQGESEYSLRREVAVERVIKALAGEYKCEAETHGGTTHTKTLHITVLEEAAVGFLKDSNMARNESVVVKEDAPYFLNCTVAGMPIPTITWEKDGKPLTPSSEFFDGETALLSDDKQRLELKYVFKKHVGVYTCKAGNRVNRVTGRITIHVPAAGLSTPAKVGLAVALIGIAILVLTVVILFRRVKRERQFKKSFRKNALYLFEQGNIGQLNPDCSADEQAELLPYGQEWEVPREHITLGKQLGSGAFGRVVKASVTGLEGPAATTVAIKMCKSQADPSQVHALTLELKIMIHLGKHLNIVNLMGAKTVDIGRGELWILVEYCRFGNLLVFMHRHRRNFINQIDPTTGRIDPSKVTLDAATPFSPLSPGGASPWKQTNSRTSQDRWSAAPNSPLDLSEPPQGYHADSGRHQVHNPLYNATLMSSAGGRSFFGPDSTADAAHSDLAESCNSDGKTQDTTTSTSSGSGRVQNTYYTSTLGSTVSHAPLSPTESGLVDSHGNSFVHEVGSIPGVNAPFTTTDLVCWAWQVAHGMDYLASRKVLHGDLAARNLLLADDNVVKISDFGLSREMYKKDVYMKKGDDLMPIKWISVEAIRDRIFSVQSDVWAFGVTLWEIFSLGSTPYPGIEVNKDFLQLLEDGYRMSCPKYANQEIYNLLLECWDAEPRNRPSFRQAFHSLDFLMQPDIKGEYLSMNDQYMRMNEERFKQQTDYLNMLTPPEYENMTNKPADDDTTPHYVNMEVAGGGRRSTNGQAAIQSPEVVSYCNMRGFSPGPAAPTNHYLPMSSSRGSQSPENDVFSPRPSEPSRFTFPQDEENASSAGIPSKEGKSFLNGADAKNSVSETEQSALINGGQNT